MSAPPSPFDRGSLWAKAKNFINRSFAALDDDDFPLAAMWAALALELLGKAALSHENPCLVAEPNDDGVSLMIAAGLAHDYTKAKSIQAKAVFSRCERAFQPFSAQEADKIAKSRNEELHSGLMPFEGVPNQNRWWERYWAQAVILIEAQGEGLESFVGSKRSTTVQSHLDNNRQHVSQHTAGRITAAEERWRLALESPEGAEMLTEYLKRLPAYLSSFYGPATCPACGEQGSLLGDEVETSEVEVDPDDGRAWEVLQVYPELFECENCGLVLEGQPYLEAAELDELILVERDYEPVWDDYGND